MIIVEETEVQEILRNLSKGARSVRELAKSLTIPAERVFRYVTALRRKGMVELDRVADRTPYYQLVPEQTTTG